MQPDSLEIQDFSGGLTDNYVAGAQNRFQKADNLLIVPYMGMGKLVQVPGSGFYFSDDPRLPSGNQRVGTIYNYKGWGDNIFHSGRDVFYKDTAWRTLLGPTSNKVFPLGITKDNQLSITYWSNHLLLANDGYAQPAKMYFDGSNNLQVRTAGLPMLASDPVITPGANTSKNYLYRFIYFYQYQAGTAIFEDFGPTREVAALNTDSPNVNANAISAIPVLANSNLYNWDLANIKVKIYRTENNGTAFYYIGQVNNGVTTYSDTMSDATLVDSIPIYTSGNVVDNELPPVCKYVHVTENNVAVYANVKLNGTEVFSNRVYLAVPGDIDAVPGDFFEEVDEEITGLSSLKSRVIVFCRSSVWSLDGFFDLLGRGAVVKTKIGDVTGCISSNSIVKTVDGIFFAGEGGFFFTDGNSVIKISKEISGAYKSFSDSAEKMARIHGTYDPTNKRIWWAVQKEASSQDCDTCYILHLNWGISQDMPFTTASGEGNFRPSAIAFVNGNLVRGDSRGYVFQHSDDIRTNLKVNTLVDTDDWSATTIIYDYKSCALNFGSDYVRKFVPRVTTTIKNETNLSLQINSINDDGRKSAALKPIRYRGNLVWGDPDIVWGTPDLVWNFFGLIIEQRRFPAGSLRCNYKQLQFTNAFVPIVTSDLYGVGNVDSSAKTFTLTAPGNYKWPSDPVDYVLAFEGDGYRREFVVLERTSDTVLTFSDLLNFSAIATGTKWELRGYPKKEFLSLLSFTMGYNLFGQTQAVFNKNESGEVGSG